MKHGGEVYIMTNAAHTTLYVGVTSNLKTRIWQHKNFIFPDSFTSKYGLTYLVQFEGFHRIEEAIGREKQLKGGSRKQKENLIHSINPDWNVMHKAVARISILLWLYQNYESPIKYQHIFLPKDSLPLLFKEKNGKRSFSTLLARTSYRKTQSQ